jgi:hypothetical protein
MGIFPASALAVLLLSAGICRMAAGQAIAEYSLGAGRAATTTAPAHNPGKQIGGVLDTLNKTVKAGEGQAAPEAKSSTVSKRPATTAPVKTKIASNKASPAAIVYEDPRHIQAGIDYEELVRRFGPPSMAVTTRPGRQMLTYAAREGAVAVEMENDRAVTVATEQARQSAVVLLQ